MAYGMDFLSICFKITPIDGFLLLMLLQQHMNSENHMFPLAIIMEYAEGIGVMPKITK